MSSSSFLACSAPLRICNVILLTAVGFYSSPVFIHLTTCLQFCLSVYIISLLARLVCAQLHVQWRHITVLLNRLAVILWSLRTWWPKLRSLIRWLWCIRCPESMRSGITLLSLHFYLLCVCASSCLWLTYYQTRNSQTMIGMVWYSRV